MLLELPKELQLMILAMLVVFYNSTHIITTLDNPTFKALRSVNHEVRSTVLDLFFGKNTFLIGHPGTTARILRGANATLAALVQDLRFDYGMTTEDLSWKIDMHCSGCLARSESVFVDLDRQGIGDQSLAALEMYTI